MLSLVNMQVFTALLNCAYDLDILHYDEVSPMNSFNYSDDSELLDRTVKQSCYIMTNDGDIEITVTNGVKMVNGVRMQFYSATFKSNLRNISKELVKDLILTQLETDAFLTYQDCEGIEYRCEPA